MSSDEALKEARQKVVGDWLFLSAAMRGCADSINRYITLVASTQGHAETVKNMLQLPSLPHMGADPFLQSASLPKPQNARPPKRERQTPDSDEEAQVGEDGKKKRKKRAKKDRDPNAPKRPGSAYIFFQNAVRNEMKVLHPEVSYRDLVTLISKKWADMTEIEKQPYQNEASEAMSTWKADDAVYQKKVKSEHNGDVPATPTLDDAIIFKTDDGNIAVPGSDDEDEEPSPVF